VIPTTRLAPTPSGYLHAGNAVNLLLTHWWARARGARLLLRIDDFDAPRARPEYVDDIFATVQWLGIDVDGGPRDAAGFRQQWSMSQRAESFRRARDHLLAEHPGVVFVCSCSRTALDAGRCVSGCRRAARPFAPGSTVVRLAVDPGTRVPLGSRSIDVPAGDHVLWRRDDLPAYQLGSVVVDEELGVSTVIRGCDLLESSALQRHLADLLPAPGFAAAQLLHHDLLTAEDGTKLSKSAGAGAHPMSRSPAVRDRVRHWAEGLGEPLGISPA
jgi:glutamyl/glutaminyl-tRNA synthetase